MRPILVALSVTSALALGSTLADARGGASGAAPGRFAVPGESPKTYAPGQQTINPGSAKSYAPGQPVAPGQQLAPGKGNAKGKGN